MKSGVRCGVMVRDPVKCVVEVTCECGEVTRRLLKGHVGEVTKVKFTCNRCEREVLTQAVPKELDA